MFYLSQAFRMDHFLTLYVRNVIREHKNKKIFLATSSTINKSRVLKILKKESPNLKIIYSKNLLYPKFKNSLILFIYQILNLLRIRKIILTYDKKYNFEHIFFQISITLIKEYYFSEILLTLKNFQVY